MIFYTKLTADQLNKLENYDQVCININKDKGYNTPVKVLNNSYHEVFHVSEGITYTYKHNLEVFESKEIKDYLFNENNMVYFLEEDGLIKVSDGNQTFEINIDKTEFTLDGNLLIDNLYRAKLIDMKYRKEYDMLSKVKQKTYFFKFNHDITVTIELFEKLNH